MGVTCKSCKFYSGEDLVGVCHWEPTTVPVEHNHWCGQYKRRTKADAKEPEFTAEQIKSIVSAFCTEYFKEYNVRYSPDWTRDTQAAKTLLKEEGEEKTLRFISAFVHNPPKWYKENLQVRLYNIPKARNQIALKDAMAADPVSVIEESKEHSSSASWPDYVDYRRKGGTMDFRDWSKM